MSLDTDVIVIGGGAAGLMAAAEAGTRGLSVLLLEKNSRPARKVMITGKGRCNVTNDCDLETFLRNVPRNGRFLYSAYAALSPQALMDLIQEEGVPLKVERGNRVFPVSDKAADVVDVLVRRAIRAGVRIAEATVSKVEKESGIFTVEDEGGRRFQAKTVVVATGGLSYPQTGSTGDGYGFARSFGHSITELRPSLVPLVCNEPWCPKLMGLSLKNVRLSLMQKGKKKPLFSEIGEMLFTHFGITGPLVLSASAFIRPEKIGEYTLFLNWKPGLDEETLDKRVQKDFTKYSNRDFINALGELLPAKSIPVLTKLSGIPAETKVHQISKKQRQDFVCLLKGTAVTVKVLRPVAEAVITAGGVSVKEVDPKTMESKLVEGLYFAGEILDVDGYTGGFNLQIAFSTGYAAGHNLNVEER